MILSNIALCAILALDLSIIVLIIKNYGELKFLKGKAAGFKESTELTKKFLDNLIEESRKKNQKD